MTAATERPSRSTDLVDVARVRHPGFMVQHVILLTHGLCALLRSRVDVALENLALRQQVAVLAERRPRPRLAITDRLFWVSLRRLWSRWADVLVVVQPDTVVRWHRQGFRLFWRWRSRPRRPGRPRIDRELRDLIRRMARENPTWGAPRIHGELLKLGFDIAERTVSRYMPRRPAPGHVVERWKVFLRNHQEAIVGMDFFTVPTATFDVLYVLFFIHHGRRRVVHFGVTRYPTATWVIQQLREAFPYDEAPRYLIFDRDSTFNQAPIAERWIGSVRREMLDHVHADRVACWEKHTSAGCSGSTSTTTTTTAATCPWRKTLPKGGLPRPGRQATTPSWPCHGWAVSIIGTSGGKRPDRGLPAAGLPSRIIDTSRAPRGAPARAA